MSGKMEKEIHRLPTGFLYTDTIKKRSAATRTVAAEAYRNESLYGLQRILPLAHSIVNDGCFRIKCTRNPG